MRDVMVRNTRAVVELRLPPRRAATLRAEPAPAERGCYAELTQLIAAAHRRGEASERLALRHLLAAAGSSPAAAAAAIERFVAVHHPGAAAGLAAAAWRDLAASYRALPAGAKEQALLELLARNPGEKVIVFAHHRDTLSRLAELVGAAGFDFETFSGDRSAGDKDAAVARFRDQVPLLLSSESGGEGRNLQFCHTLVNFDLPWNPMAIEQRIGRLHRIGQTREVFVFNLVVRGTAEEQLLALLEDKIHMFELVVGEIGAILGELDDDEGLAEAVFAAWVSGSADQQAAAFAALGERLTGAHRQYEAAKSLDDELFADELATA
jgi:SNF2 family DNA or RNA helicase